MLRQVDCQRYREWKKQQEALLKGPKQKVKKKSKRERKEITDCIEEEKKEKPKTIIKIRYRKCTPQETKKPKPYATFKPKPVSSIDLLFKRIQPSFEVRHQLLLHRHADCFTETVPQIDVTSLREIALPTTRTKIVKAKRKRSRRRKKDKAKTTISKEEKAKTTEKEEVEQDQEETVNEEENNEKEKEEEVEETIEEKENIKEEDDARAIDDKKEVKRKQKDKFWCKKFKKKIDYESEDSECDSICSFDSHICLKGLALTAEDKKKIKENRRNVQASSVT